ncbi:hypothetical protein DXG01_016562 [Tephrocybe rancida]|nr:hypothetical protein DXG01_016562 [Tephrocybe rancida]
MDLKLVYRVLRKISDWSIGGFYSDVYVEGQENVSEDGPLIIASTHHNEIIDIANLAATIPHRRHLSFWAKSSMFANPIARAILLSSGAIPVKRNPNNGNGNGASPQSGLFRETSTALAAGEVIGVFPEGTSYTQPSIMQVMSGAAWAAIDYAKWAHELDVEAPQLTIVPVGIVYTDKARYQSRVLLTEWFRYGEPIVVDTYMHDMFKEGADVEASARMAVKQIMAKIEQQMGAMSVNAPDWDTLYAAQMARDIIYDDPENIPLKNWVSVSQSLVYTLTASSTRSTNKLVTAKSDLTTYYALLHHTGISHSSLTTILTATHKLLLTQFLCVALRMPLAFLSFLFFVPPLLLHIPAYITGHIAARVFVKKGEVEGEAQFKAIFGGVGLGIGLATALGAFRRTLGMELLWTSVVDGAAREGLLGGLKYAVAVPGVAYSGVYLLVRWHSALVYDNYRRLKILLTLHKLCLGLITQHPAAAGDLGRYTRPPPPPPNPFIKKNQAAKGTNSNSVDYARDVPSSGTIPTRKLIRPLLAARKKAVSSLKSYLETRAEDDEAKRFLSRMNEGHELIMTSGKGGETEGPEQVAAELLRKLVLSWSLELSERDRIELVMEVEQWLNNGNTHELLAKTLEVIRAQNQLSHDLDQLRAIQLATKEEAGAVEQSLLSRLKEIQLSEGNETFRDGDFTLAVLLYSRAIEVSSKPNAIFYANRAACYLKMTPQIPQLAVEDCDEAIKIDANYVKAINRRGIAYEALGRFNFTITASLDVTRTTSASQHSVDRVLKELAMHNAAGILEARVQNREPGLPFSVVSAYFAGFHARSNLDTPGRLAAGDSTFLRAMQALSLADYEGAMGLVNEAVDQGISISWRDGRATARNLRGTFKYLAGDLPGARTDFLASLAIFPTYTQNFVKLARIYIDQGDEESALKCFEDAILFDENDPDIYHHRGQADRYLIQVFLNAEKYVAAAEDFTKSIALDGSFIYSHIQLAAAQCRAGNFEDSETTLQRTLELFPKRSEPLNHYGEFLLGQRRYAYAVEMLERAYELERRKAIPNVASLLNKGHALLQWKHDINAAKECCSQALLADPGNLGIIAMQALLNLQSGNFEGAMSCFDSLVSTAWSKLDLVAALMCQYVSIRRLRILGKLNEIRTGGRFPYEVSEEIPRFGA